MDAAAPNFADNVSGFFFNFLQIHTYNALTASPIAPNAQANPQKNLPKTNVNAHNTINADTKEVNSMAFPSPICVNMYFTPENAVVNADGRKRKYNK